jgi:uncharacterized protein YvpB
MGHVKLNSPVLALVLGVMLTVSTADTPVCSAALKVFEGEELASWSREGCSFDAGAKAITLLTDRPVSSVFSEGPPAGIRHARGRATSPEIPATEPFDQIIVSWNALCPEGSWVVIEARARLKDRWTKWFNLGWWTGDDRLFRRTSPEPQKDADGRVDTDVLLLTSPASAVQLRVTLCARDPEKSPVLRRAACSLSRSGASPREESTRSSSGAVVLDVPEISQLSYPPRGNVWCSPTSVVMVLNYWAAERDNPLWKTDVPKAAAGIHDLRWGGTGNWTFNTAFAGSLPGISAVCTRLNGFADVEKWIRQGVPVVLSISNNVLHGRGESGGGHLIVCVGFDEKGNPVVNDPYADLTKGQRVRRTYPRDRLLKAWWSSLGTVYLILPEDRPAGGGE